MEDTGLFEFLQEHGGEDITIYSEWDPALRSFKLQMRRGTAVVSRVVDPWDVLFPFFRVKTILGEMYDQFKGFEKGENK